MVRCCRSLRSRSRKSVPYRNVYSLSIDLTREKDGPAILRFAFFVFLYVCFAIIPPNEACSASGAYTFSTLSYLSGTVVHVDPRMHGIFLMILLGDGPAILRFAFLVFLYPCSPFIGEPVVARSLNGCVEASSIVD